MDQQLPAPQPSAPPPAPKHNPSNIYPEVKRNYDPTKPTAPPIDDKTAPKNQAGTGVPFGLALIAVFGLPAAGTSLLLELFSSSGSKLGTVYVLTQVDAIIYLLAVISMLLLSRLGRTMVIVAAAGLILIQGYYIHQTMNIQHLEATSSISGLSSSLSRSYFDSGAIIFVQLAAIAYLVRPSAADLFN